MVVSETKKNDVNKSVVPITVVETSSEGNSCTYMMGHFKDGAIIAISQEDCDDVMFAGVSSGTSIINRIAGIDYEEMLELMTRAVNNRTRQRNFFRLQNSLLEGEINEEEFYTTIDENADDYVIEETENPSTERLFHALELSKNIKDVNSSEDLSSLFSFDSLNITDKLLEIEKNGGI